MAKAKKKAAKATKKTAAKKAPAKKATTKKAASGGGFMKELAVSDTLAAVIGAKPVPRTEVTKKLWAYIKKNNLQDPKNKRDILADEKLKAVFGKGRVNMFEMTKLVGKHLK
ncbi:MAG: SWIB/MDM2 domain-containing protein [Bdellovibrionota bacterium]